MPVFNLSEIDRVTLINIDGKEQECSADLFRQWLDICPNDARDEAALTVGALCDAIRQIRNDYQYERGRAERAINQCAALLAQSPAVGRGNNVDDGPTSPAPQIQKGIA